MGFRYDSRKPIDQLVFRASATRSVPAFTAFSSFSVPNTHGKPFIPFIRYSIDGGNSWTENGQPIVVGSTAFIVSMNATASAATVDIYLQNYTSSVISLLWEVYGVSHEI